MKTKENDKKGMKTAEHTMAQNKTKNREEFISDQPNDFDDRNLDREGINRPESKEKSNNTERKGKYSDGGYDHPPQDAAEHNRN